MPTDKSSRTSSAGSPSVAKSAGRMGLATLLSRIFGLVREQVFAFLFGASASMDAFNIAFRIPNLLRDLFAEGAMSSAFVPNFTRALVAGGSSKLSAFRLLAGVLTVLVIGVSAISVLGIVFAPELVGLYASGFREVGGGKFELTVGLTRVMFPFFPMVAMAAVVMGALNALGFFFLPAFAPVLFNVASIFSGVILVPILGRYTELPPIYGMAIGVLLGGFLQFYVQWLQIRRQGFRFKEVGEAVRRPFQTEGVTQVLLLLIPGTMGLAATQVNILINSIYATSAGPGAVSWLNYAFRIMQFPIGIFGVSLAAATLPAVARKLAEKDHQGAGQAVQSSLKMSFAVNGPAMAGLMAIGLPVTQLLFQHGRFTYEDSLATSNAIFWYAVGLPGYSAVKVLVPVFYALKLTRVPVTASFCMVALNGGLNYLFQSVMDLPFWSLALATSSSATLEAVILATALSSRLPGAVNLRLFRAIGLHGVVSAGIFGGAWGVMRALAPFEPSFAGIFGGNVLFWAIEVSAAMGVAGALWWTLGAALKIEENQRTAEFILKKLRRRR